MVLLIFGGYVAAGTGRYDRTHAVYEQVGCSVCHERPYDERTNVSAHFTADSNRTNYTSINRDETHQVLERVACLTCHEDTAGSVKNGTHVTLQRVSNEHPNVASTLLNETHHLYSDQRSNAEIVDDTCLSCHTTHRQFHKFAAADPFVYDTGNGTRAAFYRVGVRDWPLSDDEHVLGEENEVDVRVENRDSATVALNVTVNLSDFANQQSDSTLEYDLLLDGFESQTVTTPPVEGDYFTLRLEANRSVNASVSVSGTKNDVPTETVRLNATLPREGTYPPAFYHTESVYLERQLDDVLRDWGQYDSPDAPAAVTSFDRVRTARGRSGYTFDTPSMLYYIRRNTTQLGQYNALGEQTPIYKPHNTGRVTTMVCAACHVHALPDVDVTDRQCSGSCHTRHEWGVDEQ